jgi:hypothetical protein
MPIQEAIRDLTSDLLGIGTAVDKAEAALAAETAEAVCGYRDDAGTLQAVLLAEGALVRALGGAIVLVPEVAVHEMERRGEIPDNLYENFYEVANIMASLLNKGSGLHTVLTDRSRRVDGAATDVQDLLGAPARQRWFNVTVGGYGGGRLGLLSRT